MLTQPEFPAIAAHFPAGSMKITAPKTLRTPHDPTHPDPLRLSSALVSENISFFTFALIISLQRAAGPVSIAALAKTVGNSYWAVRSQVVNTHYFEFDRDTPLVAARLTPAATTKLLRIEKRLS